MPFLFETDEQIDQLEREARTWLDTPFAAHAMVKRVGVDCPHLPAAILMTFGTLKDFEPGKYHIDEGYKLAKWFEGRHDFEPLQPPFDQHLKPGDVFCVRMKNFMHLCLMLRGINFIHVLPKRVVIISNLRESLYRRNIYAAFRPLAP